MHVYQAFGLTIHSEVALPQLLLGSGPPDITIRREEITDEVFRTHHDGGGTVAGDFPGYLRFVAAEGRELMFDPVPGVPEEVFRVFLLGLTLSALLRQRGLLVLHGSCVTDGEHAISFVGDCGWGKSTTAEYFRQRGYALLSDDISAIDLEPPIPVVRSGFPLVKLRQQAAEWFEPDPSSLPLLHSQTDRRVRRSDERFCRESQPLARVYLLEPKHVALSGVAPLPGRTAMLEMIRHTQFANGFTHPKYATLQLEQCSELLRRVPVRRLHRPYGMEALPEIFDVVERDLAADVGRLSEA